MEKKKTLSFTFGIVAIILGVTLFKQFDFENLKFQKTGLAIVYSIAFIISIYVLVKNSKTK
ncbi:hypothetical protein [Chryseolinea lacunae]|uniref:ATP synthase F0 sector subunit C n=1 Tax=Chryseolinea lacunae TaxID=2801331 RepID=A0ABS1KN96_9BACT|nr:hypothetical protein [Chryseolinea lacunae]MBL0740698.1 hypothetical protein [Chryseolinea lacunae]